MHPRPPMIGGLNCVFCDSQGGQDHEHPSGPRLPVCHARQRRPRCDGRQQRGRVQRQLLHPAPGLGARASGSAHVLAEERRDRHCHAGYGTGENVWTATDSCPWTTWNSQENRWGATCLVLADGRTVPTHNSGSKKAVEQYGLAFQRRSYKSVPQTSASKAVRHQPTQP